MVGFLLTPNGIPYNDPSQCALTQPTAHVTLPAITPPSDDAVIPYPLNQPCVSTVYATTTHTLLAAPMVPPTERAVAWTCALLQHIKPQAVIVVSTVEVCGGMGCVLKRVPGWCVACVCASAWMCHTHGYALHTHCQPVHKSHMSPSPLSCTMHLSSTTHLSSITTHLSSSTTHLSCMMQPQAHEYAGEGDPASQPLVFSLTNPAASPLPDGVTPMPPDLLLRGAAAAFMLQCQVGGGVGGTVDGEGLVFG